MTMIPDAMVREGEALYQSAIDVVVQEQWASPTVLQRRLFIGYAVAARFIDWMERDGIVGPFNGMKPRVVLRPQKNA